jgi:hypothetical protein
MIILRKQELNEDEFDEQMGLALGSAAFLQ